MSVSSELKAVDTKDLHTSVLGLHHLQKVPLHHIPQSLPNGLNSMVFTSPLLDGEFLFPMMTSSRKDLHNMSTSNLDTKMHI